MPDLIFGESSEPLPNNSEDALHDSHEHGNAYKARDHKVGYQPSKQRRLAANEVFAWENNMTGHFKSVVHRY